MQINHKNVQIEGTLQHKTLFYKKIKCYWKHFLKNTENIKLSYSVFKNLAISIVTAGVRPSTALTVKLNFD